MQNELSLIEVMQHQIIQEKRNYRDAMLANKSYMELKLIKAKIEFLESGIKYYTQHEAKHKVE